MDLLTCPHGCRFGFDYFSMEHNMTCPHALDLDCPVVSQCREMNQAIDRLPTARKGLNKIHNEYQQLMKDLEWFRILHGDIRDHRKGREVLTGMEDLSSRPGGDQQPLIQSPDEKQYKVYFYDREHKVQHRTVEASTPKQAQQAVWDRYLKNETVPHPDHPDWYNHEYKYPHGAKLVY